jgi:hypothetical protein
MEQYNGDVFVAAAHTHGQATPRFRAGAGLGQADIPSLATYQGIGIVQFTRQAVDGDFSSFVAGDLGNLWMGLD